MTALIETFEQIDNDLLVSIDSKIKTTLLLEDVESGSIKAWFRNELNKIDDETLKSGDPKKIIGQYLVRAKYLIIDLLDGKTSLTDLFSIEQIQTKLLDLAEETEIRQLPAYVPITKSKLLSGIENITRSISFLESGDKAAYITDQEKASFNIDFRYVPEDMEDLIVRESLENEITAIVQIKKPDYLGDSMWEFKYLRGSIEAKILDHNWLRDFRDRKIVLRPGDSLRVKLKQRTSYDFDNNPVSTKYEVTQVIEVLPSDLSDQADVFEQ